MTNITELTAKLKAAATYEQLHTFMAVKPGEILALTEALENYKAAYEEEARDKEIQRSVIDDALCKLLPGCQYMDPPDGGSVTPLEQVARMVEGYRQRIASLEARTLTVKLPASIEPMDFAPWTAKAFWAFHRDTVQRCRDSFKEACAAAGIKLQIEGE